MKVGVINYGVGNLGSVMRALEELRVTPILLSRACEMQNSDCLILPGVGNFADCSRLLAQGGWSSALQDVVKGLNRPLLGVCVGMQLLANNSTEGAPEGQKIPGLGFIPGQVRALGSLGCTLRVPHIGWNGITRNSTNDYLFDGIPNNTDFYFVHSCAFSVQDSADLIATTDYGIPITAAVRRGNVWGTQFHPEKSSRAGFRVLKNFIQAAECLRFE